MVASSIAAPVEPLYTGIIARPTLSVLGVGLLVAMHAADN